MTPADGFPSIVAKTVTDRYGEDTDNAYKQESYTKIGDCGAAMVVQCGRDFERSGADDDAEGERDLLDRGVQAGGGRHAGAGNIAIGYGVEGGELQRAEKTAEQQESTDE